MAEASIQGRRRGITVLGLLLVIIALMVVGFFLVRYLRTRQGATESPPLIRPERVGLSRPSAAGEILRFAQDDTLTSAA
jgi:hypothetical protein